MSEIKVNRTRNLRYKRSALASMGYDELRIELDDIQSACQDIHWYIDQDDDSLINALDGDEEQAWEFKMAFSDLEAKADELESLIREWHGWDEGGFGRTYNDCTVALIGNRYRTIGWDFFEEDYLSMTIFTHGTTIPRWPSCGSQCCGTSHF